MCGMTPYAEAVDLGTNLIFSLLSKLRETASNTNDSFPMVNIDDSPFSQMFFGPLATKRTTKVRSLLPPPKGRGAASPLHGKAAPRYARISKESFATLQLQHYRAALGHQSQVTVGEHAIGTHLIQGREHLVLGIHIGAGHAGRGYIGKRD